MSFLAFLVEPFGTQMSNIIILLLFVDSPFSISLLKLFHIAPNSPLFVLVTDIMLSIVNIRVSILD